MSNPYKRKWFHYVFKYEWVDSEGYKNTLTRKFDFISYHLIRLFHGDAGLRKLAYDYPYPRATIKLDGIGCFISTWTNHLKSISGWNYFIKPGDLVEVPMESGRLIKYEVIEINRMNNPKDQYFAKIEEYV